MLPLLRTGRELVPACAGELWSPLKAPSVSMVHPRSRGACAAAVCDSVMLVHLRSRGGAPGVTPITNTPNCTSREP